MLVRLLKIAGADLSLFEFDYDLTWAGFFLGPEEQIYGRYGGRDSTGPDGRLSLTGLRHAMQAALKAHRRSRKAAIPPRRGRPVLAEEFPAARRLGKNECIHCHQVYEFRRAQRQAAGVWKREEIWTYPLPENVGVTLEVDQGNRVRAVRPGSPAAKLGLRPGDVLQSVQGIPVASQADFQYGLHRAPWQGAVDLRWQRDGRPLSARLELAAGWKKTNATWRPSLLDILPSLTLYGEDLTVKEKKAIGLEARRLAFRQDDEVHARDRAAGVRPGDIILGVDGRVLEMTMSEFLGHVRRNYLVGDRVTLQVLRNGKRLDLPMILR